ncbi:ATP-binding cassette domain-containing protein [Oligoflexia bacterium]|nr:ATP-binding cassette domain-containing protein [Oligoflexia bacterium]
MIQKITSGMLRKKFCGQQKDMAVQIQDLRMVFDEKAEALRSISLNIKRGHQVSIVGPPGSGKTTLLQCIAGKLCPKQGSVRRDARIADIEKESNLHVSKTVLDNVLNATLSPFKYFKKLLGFRTKDRERAAEIIDLVGLSGDINTPISKLNSGKKMQVALAKALMRKPQIILADTPYVGQSDPESYTTLKALHRLAKKNKITTISVVRDFDEARQYSNQIVCLEQGSVTYDGTSSDPWPPRRIYWSSPQ